MRNLIFRDDERNVFDKIRDYLHGKGNERTGGKTEIIGAFDDDEWTYEKKRLENENLVETISNEFMSMIEKREKNLLNVQNPADNVTTDISSGSHKNDGPLNGDNAEIATNFTEITRFNGKSENEYIIMMSKESFERNNGPADIYIDADTHSTTNYGRNENTDEAASCIETSNFSLDDVQAEIQVGTFEVTFSRPVIGQLRPMKSIDWLILDLKHS